MTTDTDHFRSKVISEGRTLRSKGLAPSSSASAGVGSSEESLRNLSPEGTKGSVDKKLLKRSLFPKRAQPVQIGRYTVLKLLGQGGMGVVYTCFDDLLDRKVAVKVLHIQAIRSPETAKLRLVREAQAMARLAHPNIVTVHEVGEADGMVFVAMEFVRGVTLDVWVEQKPRSWQEIVQAYVQAGRGLEAAHRAAIVHRDFKPQNVIISDEGIVKVLDFGLARATDGLLQDEAMTTEPGDGEPTSSALMRPLTRTGMLLGTPAYMSPEQHLGERATTASDQFGFCVSLYQSLYKMLPFTMTSLDALRNDVLHGRIAPAPMRTPVPSRVFAALRRGMMSDAKDRFSSMSELLTALEHDPGVLVRRISALVATATVAGVASFALAQSGRAAIEQCPDAQAELSGIWDAERAATVQAALQEVRPEGAEEIWAKFKPRVEQYAMSWVHMRNDACTTHAEGRQSENIFDLRTSCLDQRRASLDALVDSALGADARTLDKLLQAASSLPSLETCADVPTLKAAIPPPEDGQLRTRVQTHKESLARAQVYEEAGQFRRGRTVVEEVLADAAAMKYQPLFAETSLRLGSVQMEMNDMTGAEKSLSDALWAALATDHAWVAADASSKRGFLHTQSAFARSASEDLFLITALNQRVQANVELYTNFLNNAGMIHWDAKRFDKAREFLEEAQTLRESNGLGRSWRYLCTLSNIGLLEGSLSRFDKMEVLYRRGSTLADEILGPDHSLSIRFKLHLAQSLKELGRPREALELLTKLLPRVERLEESWVPQAFLREIAELEVTENAPRSARKHLVESFSRIPESMPGEKLKGLVFLSWAAAADGDSTAMKKYYETAMEQYGEILAKNPDLLRAVPQKHAEALAAVGEYRAAITRLDSLRLQLAELTVPDEFTSARVSLALGRLHMKLGEFELAESALQQARASVERIRPGGGLLPAQIAQELGELALQRDTPGVAVTWLTDAESKYAATAEFDYLPWVRARFALARAISAASGAASTEARSHAAAALEALRARGREEEARAVETWITAQG